MIERCFVMIHAVPFNNGVYIFVVAFSTNSNEAERLRNAIRQHVFNEAYNQRGSSVYNSSARRTQGSLAIHWGNFNKMATPGTFRSCAIGAMGRNGLRYSHDGNQVIYGTSPTATVVALGVGLPNKTQVLVMSASTNSKIAENYRNIVRSYIAGCVSFD